MSISRPISQIVDVEVQDRRLTGSADDSETENIAEHIREYGYDINAH
jgi:hypothetical protein